VRLKVLTSYCFVVRRHIVWGQQFLPKRRYVSSGVPLICFRGHCDCNCQHTYWPFPMTSFCKLTLLHRVRAGYTLFGLLLGGLKLATSNG
jgi:hypothetical protein